MIYCIDPTVDEPIMLLNTHIGMDDTDGQGINGSLFQQELLQLDTLGKKRIQIWINSPGGVVTDGYNIYNAILKSNTPVDTYCVGCAASIAGVIFQAGRKRIMADYAWLMYHNPFGSENGDIIKTMKTSIVTMIEKRSGMDEGSVNKMMNRETFITAPEALEMKLCDSIESSVKLNTKYLQKISDSLQFHKECNKVVNTFLNTNTNKMSELTKITMRLKLNDAARQEDIVAAIDAIENRAKVAEEKAVEVENKAKVKADADMEEMDALKTKIKKLLEDKEKNQAEYEDCKAKLDAMTKDKLAAEEKAEGERVKNMIEGYAKIGRIKNEATVVLEWCNTAKELGFDRVKNIIEALPLNVKAPVITDVVNTLKEGELPTTAQGLAVKNKLKREGKI